MNVLIITSDLNVLRAGSPARTDVEKQAALAEHVVVIVLNTARNRYPLEKVSESLLIIPANSYAGIFAPLRALALARRELYFQGQLQADLVVARDPGLAGFVAWLIGARFHRPLLLHLPVNILSRGYASQSILYACRQLLGRFLVRRSQSIVISSEGTRASLADISTAIADRALMTPHFMDIESFQAEPIRVDLAAKYPQFKTVMLVVAPLERSSNVALAITVLSGVVRLYPHVGLVIVGEGSLYGRLHSQVRRLGLQDHVAFEASSDNLSSYYKTARIFLVTAPYEEYEGTIASAAAASCAIVSTPVGIAPSIIEDGVSGFLCEADDTARFIADVVLMLRKPGVCDTVRLNADLALQKFMDSDEASYLRFVKDSWQQAVSTAARETQQAF